MKQTYLLTALLFWFLSVSGQTYTFIRNELSGQASNKHVLDGFSCNSEGKSPQIYWENPTKNSKSFAVANFIRESIHPFLLQKII